MTLHLLDLRPIKDITPVEKSHLPVSIALQPDGTTLVVSRFGDLVWDFYPYIPQANLGPCFKQVDWRIHVPGGRLLTDPEHAGLLASTKDFIWSLFVQPVEERKRPTMGTLRSKVEHLKPLLRWMIGAGIQSFADLAGNTLNYVPKARVSGNGGSVNNRLVASRLHVVQELFHQRHKIDDALAVHPWPHETATSLAGKLWGLPKTKFIPDAIATRIAYSALDYVQNQAPSILAALEGARAAAQKKADTVGGAYAPKQARTAAARKAGFAGTNSLTQESTRLRTACYIVIDLFSGIRDSEMLSIKLNCIEYGKSRDGSTDVLWLHGTIYKTGMQPKRWLVPPVVQEAVDVLTRLSAPLRELLRQEESELKARIDLAIAKERAQLVKRFDTVRKHKDNLFLCMDGSTIFTPAGASINVELKRFCAHLGIFGEDQLPYPLHTHQFRRTYARFVARAELGDLLTLRDHFGHWSIDMTVGYCEGGADEYEADTELLEMIAEAKMERQSEILGGYLDTSTPLANGGHWLQDWRASVRTAENKEALIAEYAGTITLNGTGHSWCVGNAKGMGCGGLCVFEAQMCVDCKYGIIGQEHRPVWEGILEQQVEALALNDMGPGGRARAQHILEYAEKVLHRLDGQDAP